MGRSWTLCGLVPRTTRKSMYLAYLLGTTITPESTAGPATRSQQTTSGTGDDEEESEGDDEDDEDDEEDDEHDHDAKGKGRARIDSTQQPFRYSAATATSGSYQNAPSTQNTTLTPTNMNNLPIQGSSRQWGYTPSVAASPRKPLALLPTEIQQTIGFKERRHIQTGQDQNDAETLDPRKTAVPPEIPG